LLVRTDGAVVRGVDVSELRGSLLPQLLLHPRGDRVLRGVRGPGRAGGGAGRPAWGFL